ncbi:siderophore-interacting protein [Microbacterium sp. 18062]|uniref:siderophore-interacting protein n=1 Tax=Microbacterium sp. 18062 TaxID=2681410 RepID=UPI001359F578|nr:siderophore-interacting protein [Microbacterium sp. 18062]
MPKSSRAITVHPVVLRQLEVLRIHDVTPGMRRVTLTGDQLGAFTSSTGFPMREFRSPAFDDDVRLFFPYPGESEPVLPVQGEHSTIYPKDLRPINRVYTVRRYDPVARELDLDFVKHGTGAATTWAYRAAPGDRLHIGGPAASRAFPAQADWLLVAGDDTALPAIGRLLDEAPGHLRAQVFIEIAEDAHRQTLRELPGVTVTWLPRHGAEAGTTPLLLDAVRGADWWEGTAFAWVAGEQAAVRDIRRHLVDDRGVAKEDIEFVGYWKRSEVVALEEDAALPDPEKNTAAFEEFHDLADLVPPIAIRAAVGLGIGDLISRGVTSVDALAGASASDPRALGKLLRYLHAIDLLTETAPGKYGLTELGEFLTYEFWADYLDPEGANGWQSAGLFALLESVRTGTSVYASVTGREFADLRREQWYEDKHLDAATRFATYVAAPLAASPALERVEHLVIHADTASVIAREVTALHPQLRVTICALPAQADWLRRDLARSVPDQAHRDRIEIVEQSIFEPSPAADAVLVSQSLAALPDADAAHALRRTAENLAVGGRLLLVEQTFDTEQLDEHDGEADLIALTRDGTGLRTDAELDVVIAAAGREVERTETIGWGTTVRVLR